MKQSEIWMANLQPVKGSEQAGYRPVLIISGNLLNEQLDIVITCPLTSSVKHYFGNLILEPNRTNGLRHKSEVLTFQIRSISKYRLEKKIGEITIPELKTVLETLNDILRY